jgi:hypothetical protein
MRDAGQLLRFCLRPSPALAAETLFLRKQLMLYQERHTTPRRATNACGPQKLHHASGRHFFHLRE